VTTNVAIARASLASAGDGVVACMTSSTSRATSSPSITSVRPRLAPTATSNRERERVGRRGHRDGDHRVGQRAVQRHPGPLGGARHEIAERDLGPPLRLGERAIGVEQGVKLVHRVERDLERAGQLGIAVHGQLADLVERHHEALELGRTVVMKHRRARADQRELEQVLDRRRGVKRTRRPGLIDMIDASHAHEPITASRRPR